jgi:G3E family GTPase
MTKIPFYLVTGFLGSGKTTLLKRYLETFSETRKVAIIQNEYAEVSIDTSELKKTGKSFEILEMNNGSVFCVCLLGDFVRSLNEFILEHHPDVVILEASGLSDPISISQMLSAPALRNLIWLAHTYTVVDALNFDKTLQRVNRNLHQIQVADTLIINKCDLATDHIDEIVSRIKSISPFADVIKTAHCDIVFNETFKFRPPSYTMNHSAREDEGRPDVDSVVIKTTKIISPANLHLFLKKWTRKTYRMKGYVNTDTGGLTLQSSFEQFELVEIPDYKDPTQLVILGPNLDSRFLQKEFEELCIIR